MPWRVLSSKPGARVNRSKSKQLTAAPHTSQDVLKQSQSSTFAALPVEEVSTNSLLQTAKANQVNAVEVEASQLQVKINVFFCFAPAAMLEHLLE